MANETKPVIGDLVPGAIEDAINEFAGAVERETKLWEWGNGPSSPSIRETAARREAAEIALGTKVGALCAALERLAVQSDLLVKTCDAPQSFRISVSNALDEARDALALARGETEETR